jgi:hypothetical protein
MFHAARFSLVSSVVAALGVALAPAAASAERATWRALRIDGDNPRAFEVSVASLQNALPYNKRDDFEIALLTIWLNQSTQAGDLDQDGELEVGDVLGLKADTADLLAAIQRGDLVPAIEDLDQSGDDRTVASYFEQLDGLGHQGVLDLAGRPGDSSEVGRAVKAAKAQVLCRPEQLGQNPDATVRQKWCDAYFRSPTAPRQPNVRAQVALSIALSRAIEALAAGDTASAEEAVRRLKLSGLTSFERGMVEAMKFDIAYRQKLFPKAREHLQAAVDAGVVPPEVADEILGTDQALGTLGRFERAAARPRPPRLGDGDQREPEENVVPAEEIEPKR